jgi:cyanophycinase
VQPVFAGFSARQANLTRVAYEAVAGLAGGGFDLRTQGGAAEAPPQGSLVIIGGALRADNAVVWQRIVQLSGGTGARIAVAAYGGRQPERSGAILPAI